MKRFVPGLDMREMTTQTLFAWGVADEVFLAHGIKDCWATSLRRQGTWEQVLLHGSGNAIDIGIRDEQGKVFAPETITSIVMMLTRRIGKPFGGQFDVLDERDAPGGPHIHIEFDPR